MCYKINFVSSDLKISLRIVETQKRPSYYEQIQNPEYILELTQKLENPQNLIEVPNTKLPV